MSSHFETIRAALLACRSNPSDRTVVGGFAALPSTVEHLTSGTRVSPATLGESGMAPGETLRGVAPPGTRKCGEDVDVYRSGVEAGGG